MRGRPYIAARLIRGARARETPATFFSIVGRRHITIPKGRWCVKPIVPDNRRPGFRPSSCRIACEALERRLLMAAGDPDSTFGSGGVATISFPGSPFFVHDVALQSDGKLIVVGQKGGSMA